MAAKMFDSIMKIFSALDRAEGLENVFDVASEEIASFVKVDSLALLVPSYKYPVVVCRNFPGKRTSVVPSPPGLARTLDVERLLDYGRTSYKKVTGRDRAAVEAVMTEGIKRTAYVPLSSQGRSVALLCAGRKADRAFSKKDKDGLKQFAVALAPLVHLFQLKGPHQDFSSLDSLTGLANYHYLQLRLEEEINRVDRYRGSFALMLVSVDKFKLINRHHGHRIGTDVLVRVSQIVQDCLREVDVAARYSGSTFGVMLTKAELRAAVSTAERIHKALEKAGFRLGKMKQNVTVSIGCALYPQDSSFQNGLVEAAEMALSRADENGGNQTCFFHDMFE